MTDRKLFRLIEKRGKVMLVDLDNNPLQPHEALEIAQTVSESAQGKSYVYIGLRESDGLYKIGMTDNLIRRQSELGVTFVHTIECDAYGEFDARAIETLLHEFFDDDAVGNEWFKIDRHDVGLISFNCKTARECVDFINAFDGAFNKVVERISSGETFRLAADLIDARLGDRVMAQVAWYAIRKLPQWYRDNSNVRTLSQLEGLIAFINVIFAAREEAQEEIRERIRKASE